MKRNKLFRYVFGWWGTIYVVLIFGLLVAIFSKPEQALATMLFVASGLLSVIPIVIPGVLLGAWLVASGASDGVAKIIRGRTTLAVGSAALVGALIPVCGITVLPLMAALLAAGVPLAPVMAFWLSSPITGPPMFAATAATLGWEFAVGKTVAAVGLGVLGGIAAAGLGKRPWIEKPLRTNRVTQSLNQSCGSYDTKFRAAVWNERSRRHRFLRETWAISRLILIVLVPAFAAEYALNAALTPDALTGYVGLESTFAIPLAVLVGAPAYIDGYAALPLTRALMEAGMSPSAAMAFLVSGGVISIWGAMAVAPVIRAQTFTLYIAVAIFGSMLAGGLFGVWLDLMHL